jgi:hypothetical protein
LFDSKCPATSINNWRTQCLFYIHHTQHSSYPTWLLVVSLPTPHIIKRTDLGNEIAELLVSSNHAFKIPPFVNDIAAVMPWLLESAPIPLSYCYKSVATNLHFVCDSHGDYHSHPLDAHLSI